MRLRFFIATLMLLGGTLAASAQPWNGYLVNTTNATNGYIQLPSSPALNFAGRSFTFEAWVNINAPSGEGACYTLAGNNYIQSMWIGVCSGQLRSYVGGSATQRTAGVIPVGRWSHVAVTFDAATNTRRHYVNGELAHEGVVPGGITASSDAWRIFSDSAWEFTPSGAIDEVRFWDVARTIEQIRSTINREIHAATAGLVAAYALDGSGNAAVGGLHGTRVGTAAFLTSAIGSGCTTSATQLCVGPGGRFAVSVTFLDGTTTRDARVVTSLTTPESGIFWFFGENNWEVMVKVLNGCGLTSHYWVYAAGLTDRHFQLTVTDIQTGRAKQYFNYLGTPAPATTDVNALPCS